MQNQGAEFNKLNLKHYSENNRGFEASQDINKDETIMYVPQDLMIHLEMTICSPVVK
jgi:hypothetical protein